MSDASYFESDRFVLSDAKRRHLDHLLRILGREASPPPARVLEIGSGTGLFAAAAEDAGYEVTGVEASAHAAAVARTRVRGTILGHDANLPIDLPDASFDAVVMFDVIEHLRDYAITLAEARRLLRDDGAAIVITLNAHSAVRPLLGRRWSWHRDPTHVVLFSPSTLRAAMSDAGLRNITMSTILDFHSAGESYAPLKPLRRIAAVWRMPWFGDSLVAVGRR